MKAREFLMEIFGKLEAAKGKTDDVQGRLEVLKTIVHYMQGCLSWATGDIAHAENELKVCNHASDFMVTNIN